MLRSALALTLVPYVALAGVDPFAEGDAGQPVDLEAVELEDWLELPVASVSLQEEKSSQAPAAVFVLSGDDIRDQGFRTLAEVLRAVPGLFVAYDSAYLNVGVRGLSVPGDQNTRFLVMLDGMPVNNAVGIGQSYLDRELPVGVQAIERVEVIQGPIGGVYGPVAFMGAVNFVTRQSREPSVDVMLAGEANSLGPSAGELAATFTGRLFEQLDVMAHVGGFRSRGGTTTHAEWGLFDDRVAAADHTVRGAGWLVAENAHVRVGWNGLTLHTGYAHKKKNLTTAPYGTIIGDTGLFYENQTIFTSLAWEKQLGIASLLLRTGFQEAIYDDELRYGDLAAPTYFVDHAYDRWVNTEARVSVSPTKWLRAVAGGLGQYHWTRQLYGDPASELFDSPVQFAIVNVYGLVELRPLGDRVLLQGGVNWTWHGLYGQQLTPRGAAVLNITPAVTAKVFVGAGFRTPTLFEGYFDDGVSFVPNKSLRPDSSVSIEGSLDVKLARWARVGITLFDTNYAGLISQQSSIPDEDYDGIPGPGGGDVSSSYVNLPPFQVHGAQLFADVRHRSARLFGGISVQDSRSAISLRVPGFANFTANLSASMKLPWYPIVLSASGVLLGPRAKPNIGLVPGATDSVPWGGSFQFAVRVAVPYVKGLSVLFSVQNILGRSLRHPVQGDYAPVTEVPEPEVLGRLQLEWRY